MKQIIIFFILLAGVLYSQPIDTTGSGGTGLSKSEVESLVGDSTYVLRQALATQSSVALKAPLASPTFTGTVTFPATTSIGNISQTELSYLDGVTSAIQTQIGLRATLASPTFTGTVVLPSTTSIGTVSNTEIGYLDGVTSAIQTQLNAKATAPSGTINELAYFNSASTVTSLSVATYPSLTELSYVKNVTSNVQTQLNAKVNTTTLSDYPTKIAIADSNFVKTSETSAWDKTASDDLLKGDSTLYFTQTDAQSKVDEDFSSYTTTTPNGVDEVLFQTPEEVSIKKTTFASLPISTDVSNSLATKVSTTEFTAYQQTVLAMFDSVWNALSQRPDTTQVATPEAPTNLASTNTASQTTGSIILTWTAPTGNFDSVWVYRGTSTSNFTYLTAVDSGTNTYTNTGLSPHVTYYYKLRTENEDSLSAYTDYISDFVTSNWYTANVDSGDGTALATPEHFAKFLNFSLGSVHPGDTVFISGGATSMVYDNSTALYPDGSSAVGGFFIDNVDGTADNRIVFTRNTAAGRNGTPIFRYTSPGYLRQIILVESSSYLEFSYLQFDTSNTSRHQLYLKSSNTNIDIKYNNFYHLMHSGIANESPNVRILYNNFYSDTNNTETADAIWFNNTGTVYNAEIGYNNIYQRNISTTTIQHTDGMQLNNVKGNTLIHDNFIVRYAGIDGYLSTGIYADNGAEGNLYIWNNIIVTTGGSAKFNPLSIRNEESANPIYVYVYNNTFYGGSMDLAGNSAMTGSLTWKNNLFYKIPGYNNPGFNMGDGASYEFGSHNMDYNRYYINTTYPVVGDAAYTWANWLTHIGGGETNSATVTTGFTVVDNTDNTSAGWELATGSEGIEDGVDLSGVYPFTVYGTNDYFGTARTGTWNIGAYEGAGVADLATSWTNGATYTYETLTTNGDTIISAINTTSFGGCVSGVISVTTGQVYQVTFSDYILNSGTAPQISIVDDNSGAGTGLSNEEVFSTPSGFYLTVTGNDATAYIQIARALTSDFSIKDVDVVLVSP